MTIREDHNQQEQQTTQARVHISQWSPWVWIVPAIAIIAAGWLVVRYGFGGGDVTVRFADARGLDRYSPVRFRGAKVGSVQKITVDKRLREVVVRISLDSTMNDALRTGTKFWIDQPELGGGGISGLLSGVSIGIAPGAGDPAEEFVGQEYPPVLPPTEAGRTYIVRAHGLGAVTGGSPVELDGMKVGHVLGAEYDRVQRLTLVHLFVSEKFATLVTQSTRFWRAGGLSVSLSGAGVTTNGSSLTSLFSAPISFQTPRYFAGPPAPNGAQFDLYESQGEAEAAGDGAQLTYAAYFTGGVQGLAPGAAVQMNGLPVGRVRDVHLRYLPQSATLDSPVIIEIDPEKLELPLSTSMTRDQLRATMNDAMANLVQKGLRAKLNTSLVLPGASGVSLDMTGKPGTARLMVEHDPPVIPSAASSGGIDTAIASLNDVAARIRTLPIEQIGSNMKSAMERINSLVHDPSIEDSLKKLNTSLANIQSVSTTAKENVGPIVKSLRSAASSAEQAAGRAQQLIGSSQQQGYDFGTLIKELSKAALSVRTLADYLEEHPDSLLKGRGHNK